MLPVVVAASDFVELSSTEFADSPRIVDAAAVAGLVAAAVAAPVAVVEPAVVAALVVVDVAAIFGMIDFLNSNSLYSLNCEAVAGKKNLTTFARYLDSIN